MKKRPYHILCLISLLCLNLLELRVAARGFAASPNASGNVLARCYDRSFGLAPPVEKDDLCTSLWSEELQQQDRVPDDPEPWKSFHWGPYEMSELELRFLYRPGERRPLWGY